MKKTFFITTILVLVLVVPIVYATETIVKINTEPEQEFILRVINPATGASIKNIDLQGDDGGESSEVIDSELTSLSFRVLTVTDRGRVDESKDFGPLPTGGILTLDFVEVEETEEEEVSTEDETTEEGTLLDDTEETTEETEESEETTEEEIEGSVVTGSAVNKSVDFIKKQKKVIYYTLAFIVLVSAGLFGFKRFKKFKPKLMTTMKLSDLRKSAKEELEDANKKLEEAQREMKDLKGREKVFEMEEKLEKDREELDKLRRGK